jgi:WD40 repeat protein
MSGNVIVFNSYNEPIHSLLVSNNQAGKIGGWAAGPTPPKYTPSALSVPLSKFPSDSDAVFAYGDNEMVFKWDSRTGHTTVTIPEDLSLDDDLILYLTQNQAILLNSRGNVLKPIFDVTSTKSAL